MNFMILLYTFLALLLGTLIFSYFFLKKLSKDMITFFKFSELTFSHSSSQIKKKIKKPTSTSTSNPEKEEQNKEEEEDKEEKKEEKEEEKKEEDKEEDKVKNGNYSILDEPKLDVSLVFPAYNEEERIYSTLKETVEHLEKRQQKNKDFSWEIIVSNDGSKDKTYDVVKKFINEFDENKKKSEDLFESSIHLLDYKPNRGKGYAVKQGVLRSRGKKILFLDSDAATDINDFENLEKKLEKLEKENKNGPCFTFGSRVQAEEEDKNDKKQERKLIRIITQNGFHFCVSFIAGINDVGDTQCGFKLFNRKAARLLFLNQHIDRWCFDIDLFSIAKILNVKYSGVVVNWTEIEGSKLDIKGIIKMAIDLFLIRAFYSVGFWKVHKNPTLTTLFN